MSDEIVASDADTFILWAAMQAMVNDAHAPQDSLTVEQWVRAHTLLQGLDRRVNDSAGKQKGEAQR